jgi:hypothetical protein
MKNKMSTTKPIHEVRLGSIKAAVWKNETETSGPRFSVKLSRIYKDGDTWRSTESFGRDDLLLVAKIADQAHTWIHQREQNESARKSGPAEKSEAAAGQ